MAVLASPRIAFWWNPYRLNKQKKCLAKQTPLNFEIDTSYFPPNLNVFLIKIQVQHVALKVRSRSIEFSISSLLCNFVSSEKDMKRPISSVLCTFLRDITLHMQEIGLDLSRVR